MPSRWEEQAKNWLKWARAPGHDAYWDYSPSFFELLPPPAGQTLEIGCGEGRVVRDLEARGYSVVGLELSEFLVQSAAQVDESGNYVRADAERLPFQDRVFDLVVAYNSLMDIEGMANAVREAARVLRRGGHLCLSVTHPISDAGVFTSREPGSPFVIEGSYLEKRDFEETFERAGLEITFSGWAYPLEAYFRALEEAGFLVEMLREPPVPVDATEEDESERRWQRLPMFLQVRALKA
jgi:SAM-dependent methyltransferase